MDLNNYWARAPAAQISYPQPYRMAQPRMAELRFPPNNPFYRGAVDFSNYYHQPPLTLPPNMGYSQPQYQQCYYPPDDGGNNRYQTPSKWNDVQNWTSQEPLPANNPKFTYDSHSSFSYQPPREANSKSQRFNGPMQQSGNSQKPLNNSTTFPQSITNSSQGKAAAINSRALGNEGPPAKVRRINPPMPMLPPPKSKTESRKVVETSSQPKSQLSSQKGTLPSAPVLSRTRVMAGSIQQLLKWNSVLHKTPPLYETAGQITNARPPVGRCAVMEYGFCLRNLLEWHRDDWGSETKLNCIIYAEPEMFVMPSSGTIVRIVGRFQPTGCFHCLKVRKATEEDLHFLKTKLGLTSKNRKTNYSSNNSLNSQTRRTSYLEDLESLCRAPILADPFS